MEDSLFNQIVSLENLQDSFERAKRGKSSKKYVIDFEKNLKENLAKLHNELVSLDYSPKRLQTFILHDPKTRKISKSDFRDRVIHHALVDFIEPLFDKNFIFDNFANRKRKGILKAVERFDFFKRKVSKNNTRECFVLKADVKHYFENVNHNILLKLIVKKIKDSSVIWLIERILGNYNSSGGGRTTSEFGIGMPLGNLTSQFFANVYLNELDQFVKHELKAKFYIRYVDDFVILHENPQVLEEYKQKIDCFLKEKLDLELHPDKSKIKNLREGIDFLGFRVFYHHKLLRKKNLRKFERKFKELKEKYEVGYFEREDIINRLEGWLVYSSHANTFKYRNHLLKLIEKHFPIKSSIESKNFKKNENLKKKIEFSKQPFSSQKTLHLWKKGLSIKEIVQKREIKEGTVWSHLAKLIEYNQLSLWKVLPKEKIDKTLPKIYFENDLLKEIKKRINDNSISFDEIACCLAFVKLQNKKKNVRHLLKWYQRTNCYRKCFMNQNQIKNCTQKFEIFTTQNPNLKMKKKEFLEFFNNHLQICILSEKDKRKYVSLKEFKDKTKNITLTKNQQYPSIIIKNPQNTEKTQQLNKSEKKN